LDKNRVRSLDKEGREGNSKVGVELATLELELRDFHGGF